MSDDTTPAERVSRFREHTNTNSSIRPPPEDLWKDIDIGGLMEKFGDENERTPAVRKISHPRRIMDRRTVAAGTSTAAARKGSDAAATVATAEGTFGRFSRVFAHVFGGVLGKRKAEHGDAEPTPTATPEQALLDERKRQAEEAYHLAKEQGLLPAPRVFVRPGMGPRAWSADTPTATPPRVRPRPPLTPRTPGSVARSPSKKDLKAQKKLSKRVSSLEVKLASAKKELQSVLGNECFPAVPPWPHTETLHTAPTDTHPHTAHTDTHFPPASPTAFSDAATASLPGNITRKRKSAAIDSNEGIEYLPPTSDVDMSDIELVEPEPVSPHPAKQRTLSKRLKRTSSRLSRKVSRSSVREEKEDRVVVVKPGGAVPPVPALPNGVEGKKVKVVGDDGYGGLGHEIF